MAKKHVTLICDTCGEPTTAHPKRLSVRRDDPDQRRGIPCRTTPKCQGRQRVPEQLTLPGTTPSERAIQQQFEFKGDR